MEEKQIWLNESDIGTQTYHIQNGKSNKCNENNILLRKSLKIPKLFNLMQSK